MLHQISWTVFLTLTVLFLFIYYGFIVILYYRADLLYFLEKFSDRQLSAAKNGQRIPEPVFDIIGAVASEAPCEGPEDQLQFGPDEEDEIPAAIDELQAIPNSHLVGEFSAMIGEVKTLIRVIIESSETKENFEMLFCLILHKYPDLAGTSYQTQVNDFLIDESGDRFEFELTKAELDEYWTN
ncbi:hypothetical protein [Mucilaginibacter ginkgonis]|uniref:Uncharacterized protein n=1 Tax=Mucilaginibacter ginkgonis TaxID=2682091 RepID=A0A7T7FBC4_9SPHI|nr:hypothetical protein [Mucilaginibacter ginkgonis]QQL49970.1 hypothetical protein GO620_000530 [Mucilaginibacter ginkgonis]